MSDQALWAETASRLANGNLPIFAPQVVNWRNDEPTRMREAGLLQGALPLPTFSSNVAGGCSFDIECDDGNPCTTNTCDIDPEDGLGSGTCVTVNVPAGEPGGCGNGIFCDGIEFCLGGGNPTCQDGPNATCCANAAAEHPDEGGVRACTETLGSCEAGPNVGRRCVTDVDCAGENCNHCHVVCTVNADCSNGLNCDGQETCSGGFCQPGPAVCGAGATCSELRCSGNPATACTSNQDCPVGQTCTQHTPVCFFGRCCSNATEPVCSASRLRNPTVATPFPALSCANDWFPGTLGQIPSTDPCGEESPFNPAQPLGCPKYSSGVDHIGGVAPTYQVAVGPMSQSTANVPAPNGPAAPLNRIGDDYNLSNSGSPPPGPLDHINLRAIRFVGFMQVPDAIFMEFWDANGGFIEDFLFRPSLTVGLNTLLLEEPLAIPAIGRVSAIPKQEFEPNAKFIWMSTTSISAGTNNANVLFVNNNHNFNPTSTNPDMPGVLAFELLGEKVVAPLGGCCHVGTSVCTNELDWVCEAQGDCVSNLCVGSINHGLACTADDDCKGNFQGIGIFCNTCRFGDNAGAACGRCSITTATACDANSDCPIGQTCVPNNTVCNAGAKTCSNNDEDICLVNGDCPALPGVCSNSDQPCVLNADCPPGGTCGGAGTCETGVCAALTSCSVGACCATDGTCSVVASGACTGGAVFQGNGTDCEPNCCTQPADSVADNVDPSPWPTASNDIYDANCSDGKCYTGADNCADAIVGAAPGETHVVPALNPAGTDPAGIACEDATSGPSCVITITGNNATASATTLNPDSCFGVADEVDADQGWWEKFTLTDTCTRVRVDLCCSTPTHFANWAFVTTDCGCEDIIAATADPYAEDPLEANRGIPFCEEDNLWFVLGTMGPGEYKYPMNSMLQGTLGPYQMHIVAQACPDAACCLPNGTCQANVNKLECDALNGTFLGLPNRFPPVVACAGSPCTTGSCCTGPGACDDVDDLENPMTEAECEPEGTFTPGLRCHGCTCTNDPVFTCSVDADCAVDADPPGPGGGCNLLACEERAETAPNPCPLCEFEGPLNCQPENGFAGFNSAYSDLTLGAGILTADDFVPGPGVTSVSEVCVWGQNWATRPAADPVDCASSVLSDNFRVRILASTPGGLPDNDNVLGTETATAQRGLLANSFNGTYGVETYGYQLLLDDPIAVVPGTRYWLEVTNSMSATEPCYWMWLKQATPTGNNFSAGGSGARGYPKDFARANDMAFCLNGNIAAAPIPIRPCCACDNTCTNGELATCNSVGSGYVADATQPNGTPLVCGLDYTCTGLVPENDDCANALPISVGNNVLSTFCGTEDGHNPVTFNAPGDTGGVGSISGDQWFEFEAQQDCTLRVDMCATNDEYDSALAVYTTGTANCVCPLTQAIHDATFQFAGDENCTYGQAVGGPAYVEIPMTEGQCATIRVGFFVQVDDRGLGLVDVSCGAPICGDNAVNQPNEQCDGIDDTLCPAGCQADCTCGDPIVCGDGVAEGEDEQCDGLDNSACHGHGCNVNCICNSVCGDNVKEGLEECDGAADTSCGGVAGRCGTGGAAPCTCPVATCGNNFKDPNEECDGADDDQCAGDPCRAPNDPAGECTCRCGFAAQPPDPVTANTFGTCTVGNANCVVGGPACASGTCDACNQVRSMSFVIPGTSAGSDTAIRVKLTSLYDVVPPLPTSGVNPGPALAAFEGQYRYLNTIPGTLSRCCNPASNPTACNTSVTCNSNADCVGLGLNTTCMKNLCPDSPAFATFFRCARLGCTPEYRDWGSDFSGLVTYASGDSVVSDSTYHVAHLAASCAGNEAACGAASAEQMVKTERWGNVDCTTAVVPNATDIGFVVSKVKDAVGAFIKPRTQLREAIPNPLALVGAQDIARIVDAVKGRHYPDSFVIGACP
jgi:hypothetical protein